MPRPRRIDFPGAFHHVMNRGADRQSTYRNPLDKKLFLTLWERATSRFGIEVISYALMGNHYHVFVHCPDGQLSASMQFIGRAYTQEFNQHHERDGALFRGRFHSILIDSETYFAQVARYIELNPVAAGICSMKDLSAYEWSSYKYSSGLRQPPYWLSTHHLRQRFTPKGYRTFAEAATSKDSLTSFYERSQRTSNVLGSPAFIDRISKAHSHVSDSARTPVDATTVNEIETAVMAIANVSPSTLTVPTRKRHPARTVAIMLCFSLTSEPRARLAERFGFSSDESFITAVRRAQRTDQPAEVTDLQKAVMDRLQIR